jgi:hypothetical protein
MRSMTMAVWLALLVGTVGRAGAEEGKGGAFGCDQTTSKGRICVDMAWSSGGYSEVAGRGACAEKGGTPVSACSHKGAIGGCKVSMGDGKVSMSTTNWQYAGDLAQFNATCAAMGGSVVKP